MGVVFAWMFASRNNEEYSNNFNLMNSNDNSPNNNEEILSEILEIHFQTIDIHPYFDIVNEEIFNEVINNLNLIDFPFLKAIWHSRGRIVITDGVLTDIPTLAHLRGEETCNDALNTCRSFDEINGLHLHNRAYKRIRPCTPTSSREFNNIDEVRNFCNVQSRVYLATSTLFHEIGHLLNQSIALIEQFGQITLRRLSDMDSFSSIRDDEFETLFSGLPGLTRYFRATHEYAAESFALFYGFSSTHQLRNPNILRERAPRTYAHFRNMVLNYQPRPTDRW